PTSAENVRGLGEMAILKSSQARKAFVRGAFLATSLHMIPALAAVFLTAPPASGGDDFWRHKASEWSRAEALKLIRRSPWAKLEVVVFLQQETSAAFSVPTGTNHCDTDAIDKNGNCLQKGRIEVPVDPSQQTDAAPKLSPSAGFLVRWESAKPVSDAFRRLQELGEAATVAFQAPPPRLPGGRYVITVKVEQPGRAGFEPFVATAARKPVLRAALKTRSGAVTPLEVEFTGVGASSSVHFFFPRSRDGVPLLG